MNQQNFLQWFENQLLKNLTKPSVIVIDNAPYHSMLLTKTPNTSWNKAAIQEWLTTNKIEFAYTMLKVELLQIVNRLVQEIFMPFFLKHILSMKLEFFSDISHQNNI